MVETLPQTEAPVEEPMETDTTTPPVVNGDDKENQDKPAESAETTSKTEEEQKGQEEAKVRVNFSRSYVNISIFLDCGRKEELF